MTRALVFVALLVVLFAAVVAVRWVRAEWADHRRRSHADVDTALRLRLDTALRLGRRVQSELDRARRDLAIAADANRAMATELAEARIQGDTNLRRWLTTEDQRQAAQAEADAYAAALRNRGLPLPSPVRSGS